MARRRTGNYSAFRERTFNAGRPCVVTQRRGAIKANGRTYKPGEVIDWRKAGIDQRRMRQYFDAGWIEHEPDSVAVPLDAPRPEPSPSPDPEPAPEPEPVAAEPSPEPDESEPAEPETDDLDAIETMPELREIADAIGAPYKVSKVDQRQAIRDKRAEL